MQNDAMLIRLLSAHLKHVLGREGALHGLRAVDVSPHGLLRALPRTRQEQASHKVGGRTPGSSVPGPATPATPLPALSTPAPASALHAPATPAAGRLLVAVG